jgi:uncharacterized protein (TIGR03000 family)
MPMPVPDYPGDFATPSPAPAYYGGTISGPVISYGAPIVTSSGCLGSSMPLGNLGGLGSPFSMNDTGDYPTIAPPGLPINPGRTPETMPDRPATPTPAPPPTVNEDRSLKPAHHSIVNVGQNRATIQIKLPKDARLFVEGRSLTVTNGEKIFTTPPLLPDREAVYLFRVEYQRDAQTLSLSKKVAVRGGSQVTVEFEDLLAQSVPTVKPPMDLPSAPMAASQPTSRISTSAASPANTNVGPVKQTSATIPDNRARITVKLPEGAELSVDGVRNSRKSLIREFSTPVLEPGKDYSYVLRCEVPGQPSLFQEIKLDFQAGMGFEVDFTQPAVPSPRFQAGK